MSIKVLHTEWSDGWGGQEIRIINEMIAVREKGIEVFLACRDNSIIKEKAIENDIKVFTFPFKGNVDFKTLFALIRIIKEYKIDIVNTHSGKDTWVGGLAAKLSGVKFIRTRHLSNRIRTSRLNFINELADYVFTTGESVKAEMIKYNRIKGNKIISIPTGIDEKIFNPLLYNKEFERKKLNLKENEIAIGIIAVIRRFKRHDLFVESAFELCKKYDNLKFFIAGDGPVKDDIKKLIKEKNLEDKIILLGHINESEKLLTALDISILTSDSKEGVPQSVMQALLMNKKVIATNVGSTKDLYSNNNFELIEPNNLDAIVEAIEKQILNKNVIDTREYIVDNFSKKVMTEKIIKIYGKLKGLN